MNLIQIHVAMLVKLSCEKNQINYLTVVKGESCSNFEIQQCIKKKFRDRLNKINKIWVEYRDRPSINKQNILAAERFVWRQ